MAQNQYTSFSSKVIKGFIWVGSANLFGQLISWAATIIVIRLLLPSDYGLMVMATTFITLLTMLSELGVNASIIQSEKISKKEVSSIFGLIIISSTVFWLFVFFLAPVISLFYNEPKLTLIIRVISVVFFIIALYQIPQSFLIREMNFKAKAKVDVLSQVGASILAVILAFQGAGVWTLVGAMVAVHFIKLLGYNLVHPSFVKPVFSLKGVERHMNFGLTVTGDRLLYYFYTQADKIIVGKFLGNSLLGIYSVALNLASIPMEKVLPIVTQVSFASYSRIQNDLERIKRNVLRSIRTVAIFVFPLFFGMAAVTPEAIMLILGSNWETIIIPFQIICFILPLKALSSLLPPAVFAINRPWINLTNMAISCVFMISAFFVGVRFELVGVCLSWLTVYPFVFIITTIRCLKVIELPIKLFVSEIIYPFLGSSLMLSFLVLFRKLNFFSGPLIFLVLGISFGIVFYISFYILFKKNDIIELRELLKKA